MTDPSATGHSGTQATEPTGESVAEGASLWGEAWRDLRKSPVFVLPVVLIVLFTVIAIWPQWFTDMGPRTCDLARSADPPEAGHWFGFDRQGCDLYTRVIFSTRASLLIGLMVTLGALAIAMVLGSLSGYFGGWLDGLLGRIADIFFGIPLVIGAIVLLTAVVDRGVLQVSGVLILLAWPPMFRLMRSTVLSVRETDYVQAAKALGAGHVRTILRHVVPNAIAPVIAYATVFMGVIIGAEATLTFLGAGLQLPALSWGVLLSSPPARELLNTPHLLLFPSLFVSLTVLSFVLAGDTLRDALDPKLR
ncbi:ABC transporter permease [Egibacter rhizosphaerae]|uniref:ABC transporter permease n=1 Tax=Egibacter rhizosphaerae TaxID=1670831 RepID=A0A411YKN0_9ACTN|nr:ABC transporter permease [Egibacter rhizosphaerae]QBI21747.1 ABC transporter permease [Egibacter rhizosphaerae]